MYIVDFNCYHLLTVILNLFWKGHMYCLLTKGWGKLSGPELTADQGDGHLHFYFQLLF